MFIDSRSADAEELEHLAMARGEEFLTKNSKGTNTDLLKNKLGDLLLFLWTIARNRIIPLIYALSSKKELTSLLKAMHDACVR